jgi:hypothetical protein
MKTHFACFFVFIASVHMDTMALGNSGNKVVGTVRMQVWAFPQPRRKDLSIARGTIEWKKQNYGQISSVDKRAGRQRVRIGGHEARRRYSPRCVVL